MAIGPFTQENRLMRLDTPIGEDVLLITSFTGTEAMARPYRYDVEMVAEKRKAPAVKPEKLIGKKAAFHLCLTDNYEASPLRHFSGMISRLTQRHSDKVFVYYRMELVPWLWLLTLNQGCRIFQSENALEIVKKVFGEFQAKYPDLVAFKDETTQTYTKLDYCVQYRETSFNFVSRLMEQEGIFYYFQHEEDKHTLILADAPSAHKPVPDQPTARYMPAGGWGDFASPVISWEVENELRPGRYTLRDFHMQFAPKPLEAEEPTRFDAFDNAGLEVYDYPGEYARRFNDKQRKAEVEPEGAKVVKLRMEEEELPHQEIRAASLCRGFLPGYSFDLTEHYLKEANRKYVLTAVEHSAVQYPSYLSTGAQYAAEDPYRNTFAAIVSDLVFRPPRRTPKPIVQGPQTAIIVGKSGEEIWADEYGRVKAQFHWDRDGNYDDASSCWIRVSQLWAGRNWGAMFIPRVGQEVIVDFLEGDPDRPIITGRVYNQEQMPPYTLPQESTKSTIKSLSSKGGGGFNEFRFEDKKGSEQIFIHAEKDYHKRVKDSRYEIMAKTSHLIVGGDQLEKVGGDKHLKIKGDQLEKIDGTVSLTAGLNLQQKIQNNYALDAGIEAHIKGGLNVVIESGVSLTLKVGANFINLSPAGIAIVGSMVLVNSGGAAGSGAGAAPATPKDPTEADDAQPGKLSKSAAQRPPKPKTYGPAALVMKQAAHTGAPLCDT